MKQSRRLFQITLLLVAALTVLQPCFFDQCLVQAALTEPSNSNNAGNAASSTPLATTVGTFFLPTAGPIADAACDVEQLESANDSQLHVILAELTMIVVK